MKALIAVTALVASVASASAMTNANTLELERFIDVETIETLTDAQVRKALNIIHNGEDSPGSKRAEIMSLVK